MKRFLVPALVTFMMFDLPAASASTNSAEWRFRVLLDGTEIGYHRFQLVNDDGKQVLESEASFDVRFLMFNAYSYDHRSKERWSGDCLHSIDSTTNDNGKKQWVEGRREDQGFVVHSSSGRRTLAECPMTFAYWNPSILEASRLLNAQTGEYLEVDAKPTGKSRFKVGGNALSAEEWTLTTRERQIKLWYGPQQRWVGLESSTKGGRTLRYELIEAPSVAALSRHLDRS